jgi:hypothetical protein
MRFVAADQEAFQDTADRWQLGLQIDPRSGQRFPPSPEPNLVSWHSFGVYLREPYPPIGGTPMCKVSHRIRRRTLRTAVVVVLAVGAQLATTSRAGAVDCVYATADHPVYFYVEVCPPV